MFVTNWLRSARRLPGWSVRGRRRGRSGVTATRPGPIRGRWPRTDAEIGNRGSEGCRPGWVADPGARRGSRVLCRRTARRPGGPDRRAVVEHRGLMPTVTWAAAGGVASIRISFISPAGAVAEAGATGGRRGAGAGRWPARLWRSAAGSCGRPPLSVIGVTSLAGAAAGSASASVRSGPEGPGRGPWAARRRRSEALGGDRVGHPVAGGPVGVEVAVVRDRQLTRCGLLVAGLDVRLPRAQALVDRDVVEGEERPLRLLEGDDRVL